MLTGRRALDHARPEKQKHLTDWLRPRITSKEHFHTAMDPRFDGQYPIKHAYRAMKLAIHCLRSEARKRPVMSEVVAELKSLLEDGMLYGFGASTSGASPSIPSSSLGRIYVGPSNHGGGANKYGLGSSSEANVPSRFQASPLSLESPITPPRQNPGVNPN